MLRVVVHNLNGETLASGVFQRRHVVRELRHQLAKGRRNQVVQLVQAGRKLTDGDFPTGTRHRSKKQESIALTAVFSDGFLEGSPLLRGRRDDLW